MLQAARARVASRCSLCLAVGVFDTSHTKARCHLNPVALNAVVVEGGALPGALEHHALEGHYATALAQVMAENAVVDDVRAVDDGISGGGSSDISGFWR